MNLPYLVERIMTLSNQNDKTRRHELAKALVDELERGPCVWVLDEPDLLLYDTQCGEEYALDPDKKSPVQCPMCSKFITYINHP